MVHLHWDCGSGAAGDMLLASLLDAGADIEVLRPLLAGAGIPEARVHLTRVTRGGLASLHVRVEDGTSQEDPVAGVDTEISDAANEDAANGTPANHDTPDGGVVNRSVSWYAHPEKGSLLHAPSPHDHAHHHGHAHPHTGADSHSHSHSHSHLEADHHRHAHASNAPAASTDNLPLDHAAHLHPGAHRHLRDMLALVERFDAPETVRERARRVFTLLAEAEAAVHGVPVESVHFHEISGIDTAVDVLGVCWAVDALGIRSCSATPVSVGGGRIHCAHGWLPVPAPATLEIVRRTGMPIQGGPVGRELCTPTGAALLGVLVDTFEADVSGRVCGIGYGAGTAELGGVPNVVRAVLVEREGERGGGHQTGWVCELVTVLDDVTAEETAYALERCLEAGALDAYTVPAGMKKGRMGVEVTVLCGVGEADRVAGLLFRHAGTLGIRRRMVSRSTLDRDTVCVEVSGRAVRVKRVLCGGNVVRVKAEYEDCRVVSAATGMSFTAVRREAEGRACPHHRPA